MCESNCGIFQQYFYFVPKLLSLHLISEIRKFEICKTDLALSVILGDDDIIQGDRKVSVHLMIVL